MVRLERALLPVGESQAPTDGDAWLHPARTPNVKTRGFTIHAFDAGLVRSSPRLRPAATWPVACQVFREDQVAPSLSLSLPLGWGWARAP